MDTREMMLAALAVDPDDLHTRLVYADWLEDQGEGDEADRQRKWPAAKAFLLDIAWKEFGYEGWMKYDDSESGRRLKAEDQEEALYKLLMFLEKHEDEEPFIPFDIPYQFDSYSKEMWDHFEVYTGKPSARSTERPPFRCGC